MGDWDDGRAMGLWGEDGIPYSCGTAMNDSDDYVNINRIDEELVANNTEGTVHWWESTSYDDEIVNENISYDVLLQNQNDLLDQVVEHIIYINALQTLAKNFESRLDELEGRVDKILE